METGTTGTGTNDAKTDAGVKTYEPEKDPRLTAGDYKWQAGPGFLFCKKVAYEPNKSSLVLPGNKTKDACYIVMSVGPDIEGYSEGDIIAMEKGGETGYGIFIRVQHICGRLVHNTAPNSAIKKLPRGGATVNGEAEAQGIVSAMTAAD